jgi:hypothetical protein
MIEQVVVNGCSYMENYALGDGHIDLAQRLRVAKTLEKPKAVSLAIGGSANSRILRTTQKHSQDTQHSRLYVLGMTFVSRLEIPILTDSDEFEGQWTNPQNQDFKNRWVPYWKQADSEKFVDLKLKWEAESILDRTEDLMYHMLAVISDIRSRGHQVLMYQQADNLYQELLDHPRLQPFKQTPCIIDGFNWRAVAYQHSLGVEPTVYDPPNPDVPSDMIHPAPGHHQILNGYLTDYIQEHKILA